MKKRDPVKLTERQAEILEEIAKGKTNPQIAQKFNLSLAAIKFHVTAIMDKCNVRERDQLPYYFNIDKERVEELTIINYILLGYDLAQIALKMKIPFHSVRLHVHHIRHAVMAYSRKPDVFAKREKLFKG